MYIGAFLDRNRILLGGPGLNSNLGQVKKQQIIGAKSEVLR